MGVDMTKFKMIYKNKIYNCLSMMTCVGISEEKHVIKELEVIFINDENRVDIIQDEANMFQFVVK